ncbi:MAG: adenylosuccinate lyase, partial [Dehalococcoidia bacterium]
AVQRNSMRSWDEELDFRELIKTDPVVAEKVSADDLEALFDYNFYLGHVDRIFERVGIDQASIV